MNKNSENNYLFLYGNSSIYDFKKICIFKIINGIYSPFSLCHVAFEISYALDKFSVWVKAVFAIDL